MPTISEIKSEMQEKFGRKDLKNLLLSVFEYGVDYGQLLMEEERDSEDLFDAFICSVHSKKTSMPSNNTQRREAHSMKWRDAKKESLCKFMNLLAEFSSATNSRNFTP